MNITKPRMQTVELVADGKPHTIVVEVKPWSERHHYCLGDDGEYMEGDDTRFIGLLLVLLGAFLLWVWWTYG